MLASEQVSPSAREHVPWGAFNVLFPHSDGGGDPVTAVQERIHPAALRIINEPESDGVQTVAVVPVQETEAWALADGDALRTSLGSVLEDQVLGLPEKSVTKSRVLPIPNTSFSKSMPRLGKRTGLFFRPFFANPDFALPARKLATRKEEGADGASLLPILTSPWLMAGLLGSGREGRHHRTHSPSFPNAAHKESSSGD